MVQVSTTDITEFFFTDPDQTLLHAKSSPASTREQQRSIALYISNSPDVHYLNYRNTFVQNFDESDVNTIFLESMIYDQ